LQQSDALNGQENPKLPDGYVPNISHPKRKKPVLFGPEKGVRLTEEEAIDRIHLLYLLGYTPKRIVSEVNFPISRKGVIKVALELGLGSLPPIKGGLSEMKIKEFKSAAREAQNLQTLLSRFPNLGKKRVVGLLNFLKIPVPEE
jgi:hypothetical protein